MKNTTANIGARIREARIRKKMTQNYLCGTELTRNHLSLIESGKSLPSVKTICYIADRLEIPVGYLFSDDENEEVRFTSFFAIDEIRSAYSDRSYSQVITLCESIPEKLRGDEILYLYSKAQFASAISCAEKFDISGAISYIKKAADSANGCSYLQRDFTSAAKYYEALFTSLSTKDIPQTLIDIHEISSHVPAELVMYMRMIAGHQFSEDFFTYSRHRQHAEAKKLMSDMDMRHAFVLLLELSEFTSLPYYMKFRVFDDLERCAEEIGEYKIAYSAARSKLELIDKM